MDWGGAWVGEQGLGKEISDSIYIAFVLQEPVRLAKHEMIDEGEDSVRIFWTRSFDYSAASEQTTRNSLSPIQLFHWSIYPTVERCFMELERVLEFCVLNLSLGIANLTQDRPLHEP